VNKANLKEGFIGMASLPEDKKKSARLYADRCLAQEKLHLPKSMIYFHIIIFFEQKLYITGMLKVLAITEPLGKGYSA